jgi:hypothetical protein
MFRWTLPPGVEPLVRVLGAIQDAVSLIPSSSEPVSGDSNRRAQVLGKAAAFKAAAVSGALAMPPGPAGFLTIIPDLFLIWKIQGQMVSDVAAAYGKSAFLTREGMVHCLFKHAAAQAVRGIIVRSGERLLIQRASSELFERALERVGLSISERLASKALSRWVPILGAVGVGAYAYYDTTQIAKTAIETFESDMAIAA